MKIKVNFQIFLFAILFFLTKQIEIYAMLMILACLHEMGHVLAGLILKMKPSKVEITPFGVSVMFEDFNSRGKKFEIKKMLIALAGPFTNFIIMLIVMFVKMPLNGALKEIIIYANILIIGFNLLPIFPLDGGRILKSIIYIFKGKKVSESFSIKMTNIVAVVLTFLGSLAIYYFQNISIVIMLIYLWVLVVRENKRYSLNERVEKIIKNV